MYVLPRVDTLQRNYRWGGNEILILLLLLVTIVLLNGKGHVRLLVDTILLNREQLLKLLQRYHLQLEDLFLYHFLSLLVHWVFI